jgi:hypothetical protein
MANKSGAGVGLILLVAAIAATQLAVRLGADNTTSYEVTCFADKGKWKASYGDYVQKKTYRASIESQRVLVGVRSTLEPCTVYNDENWECKDGAGNFFRLHNGVLDPVCEAPDICEVGIDRDTYLRGKIRLFSPAQLCEDSRPVLDRLNAEKKAR